MWITYFVIVALAGIITGGVIGIFIRKKIVESKIDSAEDYSKKVILEASKQAETIRKEAQLQAKDKLYQMKLLFTNIGQKLFHYAYQSVLARNLWTQGNVRQN